MRRDEVYLQNGQDALPARPPSLPPGTDVEQGLAPPEEPTADKHLESFFKEVTVIKVCQHLVWLSPAGTMVRGMVACVGEGW
jgi:hypothetical protein